MKATSDRASRTPSVLVSLVGIEKVVPRMADLAVMLKLLTRSATGAADHDLHQHLRRPAPAGEKDGPEEFHLVLIDNGRTEILASEEYRETLRCIRCGACLNACPIYRKIGGHAYGSVYPGPIGALITPLFQGLGNFKDLPQASSLCGACYEACPVKINIPRHLINMRRDIVRFASERLLRATGLSAVGMGDEIAIPLQGDLHDAEVRPAPAARKGERLGHESCRSVASGWTQIRDMPAPAKKDLPADVEQDAGGQKC